MDLLHNIAEATLVLPEPTSPKNMMLCGEAKNPASCMCVAGLYVFDALS